MATLLDTRDAFRRLRDQGGFTDNQADAIVDILTDVDEQVATRSDVERLDEKIEEVEQRLDGKIEEVEQRLTQRIELSEERLGQQIEQIRSDVTRTVVASVAAVGAVLAVVIPTTMFLLG